MKIADDIPQQGEAWFRLRAGRPTASQFSRIITPLGKASGQAEDYILDLIAESIRPDEGSAWTGNRHTDRGNELEPEAREWFAERVAAQGLEVREVGFVTRDDGIVGCSPDALIYRGGDPVAGLEIKCPMAKNHLRDLRAGEMPATHRPQVHGSMAVTGLPHWFFLSWCPGFRPLVCRVDRNDYTESVSTALDGFLLRYADKRAEILPGLLPAGYEPEITIPEPCIL